MTEAASSQGPLDGIRVLDFTNMLSGPYCTRLLADMGAEVIKVEPREGDHNRNRRPVREGHSSFFGHLNCGKKSVLLNLKSEAGRNAAIGLAKTADVVVENWRPGVAERLGVGYEALRKLNPGLVYCSISGFGQKGPIAQRPAYAPIVHAASGFDLAQVEYQGGEKPANTATFIGDVFGGMSAFAGIQTALMHRFKTGLGQYIDVALMDGMLNLMVNECQEWQAPTGRKVRVYQPLSTKDGYIVVAPTSARNFEQVARAVEHPEWITDERFSTPRIREANWAELMALIELWTRERTGEECEAHLMEAGVPCTRYRTVQEAMSDAQMEVRGGLTRIEDPAGSYWVPNAPFQISGLNTAARNRVAQLGEDTVAVLGEILNYSGDDARACT
jgi:CoA:oxalate CoA-transferase